MLGRLAEMFPSVPSMALTASADAKTRERHPHRTAPARLPLEFVASFARPGADLTIGLSVRFGVLDTDRSNRS